MVLVNLIYQELRSDKDCLMKIRYLYRLKLDKDSLGLINNDIDFKNKYYKDMEEFKKKFIGIK